MNAATVLSGVTTKSFAQLADFIKEANIALFTTVTSDGRLHSRPLLTREVDVKGHALWFFVEINFTKAEVILNDREVALSYVSPDRKTFASVSGRAHVVHDQAKIADLWTPSTASRFPKSIDDPRIALMRVDVAAVEYWDSP